MKPNDVCDDHAIPERDYVHFINRLREVGKSCADFLEQLKGVGKTDILEPNLATSPHREVCSSLLKDEATDGEEEKRTPNNGSDVNINHTIRDSDYTQFCNNITEGINSDIPEFGCNTHRGGPAGAKMEGVMADSDMTDCVDEEDSNHMCNDNSIPDSGYLLFLDHLREDGNSYFLELVDQNGSLMIFKYDEEEEVEEEEEEEEQIEEEEEKVEEEEEEQIKVVDDEEIVVGEMSKLKKQKTEKNVVSKMPSYKEQINYGTDHNISESIPDEDSRKFLGCLDVDASYQKYLSHVRMVDGDLVFDENFSARKSVSEVSPLTKHMDTKCLTMDVAYQEFLNCLRLQDGYMILDLKSGGSIHYEEPSGLCSGFTKLQKESTCSVGKTLMPCGTSHLDPVSHFKVYDKNTREVLACSKDDSFNYKEKLMVFISRPYNQDEYEELLEEVTIRKPLCRQKHLRNMSKVYATNLMGMSYLDHHPQLAKLLKDADSEKRLTLLRGFFFWLKNLCHDGAFQPWMPLQARNSTYDDNQDTLSSDDVRVIE